MRISALPFALATLGLACQVSAGPIRIYVLAPERIDVSQSDKPLLHDVPVATMRWGLAAASAPQAIPQPMIEVIGGEHFGSGNATMPIRGHRCSGGARAKAVAFSNWLREKVGLEPIAPPQHHPHFHHGRPKPHRPENSPNMDEFETKDAMEDTPRFRHFHHHAHAHHIHGGPSSFLGRIQRALLTLGPWEGRFVAFVIGCGIGSLMRMFYVLSVLTYRSFKSRKDEEEDHVIFDVEEIPPPVYIADRKIALVDEKVSM